MTPVETRIQQRVSYKRFEEPIKPKAARGNSGAGLLFAPRVDLPDPNRIPPPVGQSSVFFALSRSVIYALDDTDGKVLWATRVGIDSETLPLYLPSNELHPELVLVVSNDGASAGITASLTVPASIAPAITASNCAWSATGSSPMVSIST